MTAVLLSDVMPCLFSFFLFSPYRVKKFPKGTMVVVLNFSRLTSTATAALPVIQLLPLFARTPHLSLDISV